MLADARVSVISKQLNKMFMGVHDLCCERETDVILAMKSADGEVIRFEQPLQTQAYSGYVEQLLSEVIIDVPLNTYKFHNFTQLLIFSRRIMNEIKCWLKLASIFRLLLVIRLPI